MVEGILMPTPAPWWLPNPKSGPPASHVLAGTHCTTRGGWLVDHPTMSGGIGAEETPSLEGFPWNLWLLGSEEGKNDHPGRGSPELCGLIGNAPRSPMWSGAGAPPMSCPPGRRLSPEPRDARCCWGAHGSCSHKYSCFPYSRAWRGGIDNPKGPWGKLCFRARGSCPFGGKTWPYVGKIPINNTGICPLTYKTNPCRFGRGHTLGAQLDLHSLGSLQATISYDPVAREVWYEYQCQVITRALLQLPQFKPSKL